MSRQIIQHDFLVSCPSDVQKELGLIRDSIEEFNKSFGDVHNTGINQCLASISTVI